MSKTYCEGFQQPTDFETGAPIPGSPRIGRPTTNRPYQQGGNGIVVLNDATTPESNEPGNPSPAGPTRSSY